MTAQEYLKSMEQNEKITAESIKRTSHLPFSFKHELVSLFLNKFIKYDSGMVSYDSAILYRAFKQVIIETYYDLSLGTKDDLQFDGYDLLEFSGLMDYLLEDIQSEYEKCLEILEFRLKDIYREQISLEAIISNKLEALIQLADSVLTDFTSSSKELVNDSSINEIKKLYESLSSTITSLNN